MNVQLYVLIYFIRNVTVKTFLKFRNFLHYLYYLIITGINSSGKSVNRLDSKNSSENQLDRKRGNRYLKREPIRTNDKYNYLAHQIFA